MGQGKAGVRMRRAEVEALTLQVADDLQAGHPIEDDRIELKASWSADPRRTARQLVGACNAARGAEVVWIFGLQESPPKVTGCNATEVSTWWAQVRSHIAGESPTFDHYTIAVDGLSVVALVFDTEGVPFLFGATADHHEVAWREGTATRSATRSDLVRMLVPRAGLPTIEVLDGMVESRPDGSGTFVRAEIECFLVHDFGQPLSFPHRLTSLTVFWPGLDEPILLEVEPAVAGQGYLEVVDRQVIARGPGHLFLIGYASRGLAIPPEESLRLAFRLGLAGTDRALVGRSTTAPARSDGKKFVWRIDSPRDAWAD